MRVGFAARVLSTKVADAFDQYSKVEKFKTNPLALQRYLRVTAKAFEAFNTRYAVGSVYAESWKRQCANLVAAYQYFTSWAKKDKKMKDSKRESKKLAKELLRNVPRTTEETVRST